MEFICILCISYLIGAVPFAYVIGKVFYQTDVRNYGSGNLGGSNTGRVLGKKAGLAVMTLDLLKVTVSVFLALQISTHPWAAAIGAVSAAIGHCYPIFVHFRGGKAVAALYGFLFALWCFADYSPAVFFLPLITFWMILAAFRIVSLSSILSSIAGLIYVWCTKAHISAICATVFFVILIVYRHKGNIRRMIHGTEQKITWMK